MPLSRQTEAQITRDDATELAGRRPHPEHRHNNEEHEYRQFSAPRTDCDECGYSSMVTHLANFTKGLPHDEETGLLLNPVDYKLFVTGIQTGDPQDFKNTPLGPGRPRNPSGTDCDQRVVGNAPSVQRITTESTELERGEVWLSQIAGHKDRGVPVRAWESAGAGNVFDLEGPDAQAVTMPPAPRLDSEELLAEIAEVYAMGLIRDYPFRDFPLPPGAARSAAPGSGLPACVDAVDFEHAFGMLQDVPWFAGSDIGRLTPEEESRRRQLNNPYDLFRGQTPGENVGPYISQFLLLGNQSLEGEDRRCSPELPPREGRIAYGSITIDQRVRIATPCKDYMTIWEQYVDVQNGAALQGAETYEEPGGNVYRFIATPRDLATYVHYDALYEAYVNACIFLLSSGVPFDRGIPFLEADIYDKQQGFAHFGGPHILTLVAEVATRALKAVRFQKFNVHRRLRPEAVGGRIDRWVNDSTLRATWMDPLWPLHALMEGAGGGSQPGFTDLPWGSGSFLDAIQKHNADNNSNHFSGEPSHTEKSFLLPMAFPEGSPMHPAYGAGHATVAGACVTILKAYFDHGWTPSSWIQNTAGLFPAGTPIAYEASRDGTTLQPMQLEEPLTVEGELNKLCANISIGRNWAGVHYYTDYIESIRMGERIAIGLLEEQKLTYPENFSMTVPLFDGGAVRI